MQDVRLISQLNSHFLKKLLPLQDASLALLQVEKAHNLCMSQMKLCLPCQSTLLLSINLTL